MGLYFYVCLEINMNFLKKLLVRSLFLIGLALNGYGAIAAESELSAQESVDAYISTLLTRVEEIQPLYEGDQERYFDEVELALSAFVDFREVARGVMAKYGAGPNGASAEQLTRFAAVFQSSLVEFYGSALASYEGGRFEFLERRRAPSNPESATNVRMNILGNDGTSIEVQYTMFLNDERVWKLKNLYVEGVNLRRQYYSRFDNLMANNDYDINQVIANW
jgi:phospholipid transport system substrate-binding protein